MQQLTVLGLILALISGLVGVSLMVHLLRLYPLRFLRILLNCLLWFNLLVVFGIAFRYAELHLTGLLSSERELTLSLVVLDLMAVLKLCFLRKFLEASALAAGQTLRVTFKRGYWIVSVGWVSLLLILTAMAPPLGFPGFAFLIHSWFEFFILSGILTAACYQLFRSFKLNRKGPRTAAQIFLGIHLLTFSAVLISVLSGSIFATARAWQIQSLNSLLMFVYNALLVAWAYRYVPVLEPVLESEPGMPRGSPGRLKRFRITTREREVIELICQGKSNQEIADSLFISLQTVKDHVYNIFQKTGVKNRVHLVRLFSDLGAKTRE